MDIVKLEVNVVQPVRHHVCPRCKKIGGKILAFVSRTLCARCSA